MIVDHERKEIIFTPPHTGSRSLNMAYQRQPNCMVVHGPNPEGRFDHHFCGVHPDDATYRKFVLVRNPYERLVGLWFHLCEYHCYCGFGSPSFADFVVKCATEPGDLYWLYWWPIKRLLDYYGQEDASPVLLQEFADARGIELPVQPATFRKASCLSYWADYLFNKVESFYECDVVLFKRAR